MNLENLSEGLIVNNYKEMCSLLEEKHKAGKSKKYQLLEWERYFNYEKKGHKFIIKEIYSNPLEKIDNRINGGNAAPYTKDVELLLIDLLLLNENKLIVPNIVLLQTLKLVNHNYPKYFGDNRPLLANGLNLELDLVNDYYNNVNSSLTSNLNSVINRLEKKKLIVHKEVIMVKSIKVTSINYNEYGNLKLHINNTIDANGIERLNYTPTEIKTKEIYREATENEILHILRVQREIMKELGFTSEDKYNALYKSGLTFKFNKMVNKRLLNDLNIVRSFKAHHILFNNDHLEEERHSLLNQIEKELIEDNVNEEVRKRIISNAKNRSDNASQILIDVLLSNNTPTDKILTRSNISYTNGYDTLNTFLINNKLSYTVQNEMYKLQDVEDSEHVHIELPELM